MSVLFVDDEPMVLQAIRRMLDVAGADFESDFADNGQTALAKVEAGNIDAIVTEMKMPGMSGADLLGEIAKTHPEVVRVVLSANSAKKEAQRLIKPMHQFLSKPCDAATITSTLSRARALQNVLSSERLVELIDGLQSLPSLPSVYRELSDELYSDEASVHTVGEIISRDAAMTARILQLANSAMFGLRNPVSTPARAASMLGLDTIATLVLTIGVFQQYEGVDVNGFSIDGMMRHSLEVAAKAREIARLENIDKELVEEVFTAGVLHDIGKLVLLTVDPQGFEQSCFKSFEQNIPMWQAEQEVFGADHAGAGAYLLSTWGIPQSIIEVVAFHHSPLEYEGGSFSPLSAVYLANSLIRENAMEVDETLKDLVSKNGFEDKLPRWQEICHGSSESD